MIWLLLVPLAGLLVWGILDLKGGNDGGAVGVILSGSTLTVLLVALPCITIGNGALVAEMQMFYETNTQNYQVTIDETSSYLSESKFTGGLLQGSLEKLEQAGYVSERIKEWRDAANDYNIKLASFQYYNKNWIVGALYPDEVSDMKRLTIGS